MRSLSVSKLGVVLAIGLLLLALGTTVYGGETPGAAATAAGDDEAQQSSSEATKPYTVECPPGETPCKVGEKTYIGWRTFSGFCERCHGSGGLGSMIGPNLIKRIREKPIDKSRFVQVVSAGWDGPMSGQMPAFGQNPNVNKNLDELWSYLRARVDGKIPPGRPDKIGEKGPGPDAPPNWE